jgi:cytoskeleton protein RodZ
MPPQAVVESPPAESPTPPAADAAGQPALTAPAQPAALQPPQAAAAPPAQPALPVEGGRQLVFVFGEKSWIEVKDASQRIIFTGEQAAGSRQAITGKPPFQLVIGNAGKVQVFDGDRQVDIQPFIRAEVARLTLQ